jgi:hypothetical protein
MQTWTKESIIQRLTKAKVPLEGVKVGRASEPFLYFHRAEMNTVPSMVAAYRTVRVFRHDFALEDAIGFPRSEHACDQ